MAVPKKKTSKARRDNRRSHHALNKTVNVVTCKNCKHEVKPHRTCDNCGTYAHKDRKVTSKPKTSIPKK